MSIGILPRMPKPKPNHEPEKMRPNTQRHTATPCFSPLFMAIPALCVLLTTSCTSPIPAHTNTLTPQSPAHPSPAVNDPQDTGTIETPSAATLTSRLIDLDPAIRWACSHSGIAVERVEKPNNASRIYHLTDARQTPMRLELACDDFTRAHFTPKQIKATAVFGRFPDEPRQRRLLRKIQQRANTLAKRTR